MRPEKVDFLFVGVGGQGVLTASDICAEVGLAVGYDAKKSEVHGFSQRGGVVDSHVRWAPDVAASTAEPGQIDFLLSFELVETARWLNWLRPGGVIIANTQQVTPMSVSAGSATYPPVEDIIAALKSRTDQVILVDGLGIAQRLGNDKLSNTILLGTLSTHLDIDPSVWAVVIERRIKAKYAEINRAAFLEGRQLVGN
jgi:indolepyruvate ferredoxin oxidoreductase beta subunit